MARRRSIVGIGEALLAQRGDEDAPAGLAALVAINAARLGHDGIAVSRVGQDEAARTLQNLLRSAGVNIDHVQHDPDLPTARLVSRAANRAGRIEAQTAFDNLQWDFDLPDVAQRADAVVFGTLARRGGQTRSTIDRFLAECAMAMRVIDLTNRPPEGLERGVTLAAMGHAQAAIIDHQALRSLMPGRREADLESVRRLMGVHDLAFALVDEPGEPLALHTPQDAHRGTVTEPRDHDAVVVGLVHAVLAGRDLDDALRFAEALGEHCGEHPGEPVPEALLNPGGGT